MRGQWLILLLALIAFASGIYDLYAGESTLSSGRHGSRTQRTVTREADGQEYYGFVAIKLFAGCCFIGLYRFINKGEDTWY